MSSDDRSGLRPVERAVLRHVDAGATNAEIAWRFRRTPRYVRQVREFSELRRQRPADASTARSGLLAIERCVLKARETGADYAEIAARLRRSPSFVGRVEMYASYKLREGRAER